MLILNMSKIIFSIIFFVLASSIISQEDLEVNLRPGLTYVYLNIDGENQNYQKAIDYLYTQYEDPGNININNIGLTKVRELKTPKVYNLKDVIIAKNLSSLKNQNNNIIKNFLSDRSNKDIVGSYKGKFIKKLSKEVFSKNNHKLVVDEVNVLINRKKISNQIIGSLLNINYDNGSFNLKKLKERAIYNAIQRQIDEANLKVAGLSSIETKFSNYFKNNFLIITCDLGTVSYVSLFKLKFTDENISQIVSCRNTENKNILDLNKFLDLKFDFQHIYTYPDYNFYFSEGSTTEDPISRQLGLAYGTFKYNAEELRLRRVLENSKPISAEIGKKDGLVQTNRLFYVAENRLDKKTGDKRLKRIAYVRSKITADNTDKTTTNITNFYRVSGLKKISDLGQVLVEPDFWTNTYWGAQFNNSSFGLNDNAKFHTSSYSDWFIGFHSQKKVKRKTEIGFIAGITHGKTIEFSDNTKLNMKSFPVGISLRTLKSFYLRNIELQPYIGAHYFASVPMNVKDSDGTKIAPLVTNWDEPDDAFSSWIQDQYFHTFSISAGLRTNINLGGYTSIFLSFETAYPIIDYFTTSDYLFELNNNQFESFDESLLRGYDNENILTSKIGITRAFGTKGSKKIAKKYR
jgi:hypothetical protein